MCNLFKDVPGELALYVCFNISVKFRLELGLHSEDSLEPVVLKHGSDRCVLRKEVQEWR